MIQLCPWLTELEVWSSLPVNAVCAARRCRSFSLTLWLGLYTTRAVAWVFAALSPLVAHLSLVGGICMTSFTPKVLQVWRNQIAWSPSRPSLVMTTILWFWCLCPCFDQKQTLSYPQFKPDMRWSNALFVSCLIMCCMCSLQRFTMIRLIRCQLNHIIIICI